MVQAGTVGVLVKRLGFREEVSAARAEVAVLDALVADLIEIRLSKTPPLLGTQLHDHFVPDGARVALVVRGAETFVPDGDTTLALDDVLLLAVSSNTSPDTFIKWAT